MKNFLLGWVGFFVICGTGLASVVEPSAYEQYLLELINRARADPAGEASRYGIELNEGVPEERRIEPEVKQPLVMNPALLAGARGHATWMLENDIFSHNGESGSTPGSRMAGAGYVFSGSWTNGENIGWFGRSPWPPEMFEATRINHENLFIDKDYPGRGHRVNMLYEVFDEVGLAVTPGLFYRSNVDWEAVMVVEDFAKSGSTPNRFVTGVSFEDGNGDRFYTPGEGLSGVLVSVMAAGGGGEVAATTSRTAGGYEVPVPDGHYDVLISGPYGDQFFSDVMLGSLNGNVKLDYIYPEPPVHPWRGAHRYASGWRYSIWFGFVYSDRAPWVYSSVHGWQYVLGDDPDNLWMYDLEAGWIHTTRTSYPFFYSTELGGSLFVALLENGRELYRADGDGWVRWQPVP